MAEIANALAQLDRESVLAAIQEGVDNGTDPLELVDEAREGLQVIGLKFEQGDYFLMELLRAAQIFQDGIEILNPVIEERYGGATSKGIVVLGTVKGDIHDLGKGIVANLLECAGFTVVDLGVDVPAQAFVDTIREQQPQVIGLSALLTGAFRELRRTVDAIEEAGLRDSVKIIVGGGIAGEIDGSVLDVDHATTDANQGVRIIEEWVTGG